MPIIDPTTFTKVDWSGVSETEHSGETGTAFWKTLQFGDVRIRMVRYSPGYRADHWCARGHILLVLEGMLQTELQDSETITLDRGAMYVVADNSSLHRSYTQTGASLFIVD